LNLAFASDGRTLVSSADDRTVKLWDATGDGLKERLRLDPQPDWAPALTFAANDKAIVVGRLDGTVEFYDPSSGKVLAPVKPELSGTEPRGIQRGREAKIKLTGSHLMGVTGVQSHLPKLTVELDQDAGQDTGEIWIRVKAPNDLPRGSYELSVVSPAGESGKIKLHVDDLPQVYLSETNKSFRLESLPADVWATHEKGGDVEQIEFDARAGQTLVFDAAAKSLGSRSDLVLTLFDSTSKVLASNNGFDGSPDPFLAYTFAAGGRYSIRVGELLLGASREHFYRLSVGELACVTGCFPLGVPANGEWEVKLAGHNLPPDHKIRIRADQSGEIELPLDAEKFRSRRIFKLIVGDSREAVETEPKTHPNKP